MLPRISSDVDLYLCGIVDGEAGWLRASALAERHGLPICSHGMHELHVSLVASQAHAGWVEVHSFPIDAYTLDSVRIEDDHVVAPERPGVGVVFDWAKLEPFEVARHPTSTQTHPR